MKTLIVATRNRHKVREIGQILGDQVRLHSLEDFPEIPEISEEGMTFEANAIQKAVWVAARLGLPVLADDSGLEVDALDGAPGVHSARFAGLHASSMENNAKLLRLMEGVPGEGRSARFRCVVALALADGKVETVQGVCEGTIAEGARGPGGFGYDPLFIPRGHDRTFAELDAEAKNRISHRGMALELARALIQRSLDG